MRGAAAVLARQPMRHPGAQDGPQRLRVALGLGVLVLAPLLYLDTARSVVAIWMRSGTFAHCFVILPISAWLVWQRRAQLAQLPVRGSWAAVCAIALCGACWLLAGLADVQIARQYMLALMLVLAVPAVFGLPVARAIAFPLLFVLFAVPAGESLINPLIRITAAFTVEALRLSGIPVLREGNNFSIPTGNWSVVEACSGLRYLISSATLGCLYAWLTYRSWRRRAVFILVSLLLPIAANGVRAYLIVMIGHTSGMRLAVGVDHVLYGWLFFGLLMAALFWAGRRWQEPARSDAPPSLPLQAGPKGYAPLAGAVLALAVWPAAAWRLSPPAPPPARLPPLLQGFPPAAPFTEWAPAFTPASATLRQFQAMPEPAALMVYYYRDGGLGRLVSSGNRLTGQRSGWHETTATYRDELLNGARVHLRETVIGGRDRLLVWQWYVIGGAPEAGSYRAKLLQLRQRLMTGYGDGAIVIAATPMDEDPAAARRMLRKLAGAQIGALRAAIGANDRH